MSAIDEFRAAVSEGASTGLAAAVGEVADALTGFERRNLIACMIQHDPTVLVVVGARTPELIAQITGTEATTSDGAAVGAITDPQARGHLLASIEERALELLRQPAPPPAQEPTPRVDDEFPLSVKRVAARIVDLVTRAPLGTTPEDDIEWHSPAIAHVYGRYRAIHGGTGGQRIWIDRDTHEEILGRIRDRIDRSRDGGEALRTQFAHTKSSGWQRGAKDANVPLPWYDARS